jgi:hypothetical protein
MIGLMVNSDDVDACRRLAEQGAGMDSLLSFLRARGQSKLDSIAVVARLPDMDLKTAKSLVHNSPVWADRLEADDAFHDDLERAVDEVREDTRPAR